MTDPAGAEAPSYRLPTDSVPVRYDLRLAPDLDTATFIGDERVEIEVRTPTAAIVMNAVDLEITSATLTGGWVSDGTLTGDPVALVAAFDEALESVALASPNEIAPGRYTVEIEFSGELNDKLCGFYRSTFTDDDGVERVIATTQFEETDARRAFPCYDEPERKAIYGVTLDVPSGLFAVSNSPEIESTELANGSRRVLFADTMVMSTYLVAFIVGPLEATEPFDVDGVPVRVVHVPGKAHLTAAAIECAAHTLRFYHQYFDIAYPGDKLDLIAIPDFAAGAMENLGCVTFREAILLADPENSSRSELERLAEVVEHEIAHMWFGDLVTMKWWNGIWLNEAFATFMALCCLDDYRPDWQTFVGFSRDKGAALAIDGLHATRPIEFPVHHPDDAAAMFDVLTYEKGASVLWMLEQYLGRDRFREGVRQYLKAHAHGNTETTDLWDAIERAADGEPVRELMDTWIFQGGYPLIEARADSEGSVRLAQTPFSYLPADAREDSAIGSGWLVPVLFGAADSAVGRALLGSAPVDIGAAGTPRLNVGGSGFYRLSYDEKLLAELLEGLDAIPPSERHNVVADTWAVAVAGRGSIEDFLAVVRHLGDEADPYVWSVVIGAIGLLDLIAAPEDRPELRRYVADLLGPIFASVGWTAGPNEDEQTPLLRSSLVSALATIADDPAVIAEAKRLFALDMEAKPGLPADLASAVLSAVMAHATRAEFDAVVERYRHPRNPMDEVRHLSALAGVRDEALAAEVRELCRSEVRSQNAPYILGAMVRNRYIGPSTFAYIVEHFDELAERFPDNSIHRMLEGVSGLVAFDDSGAPLLVDEVRDFLRDHVPGARRRLIEQSIERLEVNVLFALSVRGDLGAQLSA